VIKFSVLSSSSKGNSVLVQVDKTTILLDCGLTYKRLTAMLGRVNRTPADIDAVFVTHDHGDHVHGIKTLKKNHKKILCHTFSQPDVFHGVPIIIGGAKIIPVMMDHDVTCYGFVVHDDDNNKLAYITDTNTIPCDSLAYLMDCQAIIVEANHDAEMLQHCNYDLDRIERLFKTHLRNEQMHDIVSILAWDGLKFVVPYHLSASNNSATMVTYEAKSALKEVNARIVVAEQSNPTELLTIM